VKTPNLNTVHLCVTIALAVAVGLIGWHDQTSRRAIVAEMDRRIGGLDRSPLGSRTELVLDAKGQPIETGKDESGNQTYKRHKVSISLTEMVENLNSTVSRHEAKLNAVSEGQMDAIGNFIDESELYLLAQSQTMDVLRLLRGQDFDGDGIVNEQDDCIDIAGVKDDPNDPDHYSAGGNGCPLAVDVDKDNVADYRDACIEAVPTDETVADAATMRGPKSLFPKDQGCSPTQVRNRCTKSDRMTCGEIELSNCPANRIFQCTWDEQTKQYKDCDEVN